MSTTNQSDVVSAKPHSRWRIALISIAVVICVGAFAWWKVWPKYPYGVSHSCSKALGLELRLYANDHDGWYPYGMKTPEASLSLLCTNNSSVQGILRGKHLPQEVVDRALANNGLLGPASCGWHYIEGLREEDDPQLAVLWDRIIGLDHNGRLKSGLQHEVITVDGSMQYISKQNWPAFVQQQKRLLAETAANRTTNSPPIRWSDEETLGPNTTKPGILKR